MFDLGQSYSGQVRLRPILLRSVLLRPISTGPISRLGVNNIVRPTFGVCVCVCFCGCLCVFVRACCLWVRWFSFVQSWCAETSLRKNPKTSLFSPLTLTFSLFFSLSGGLLVVLWPRRTWHIVRAPSVVNGEGGGVQKSSIGGFFEVTLCEPWCPVWWGARI